MRDMAGASPKKESLKDLEEQQKILDKDLLKNTESVDLESWTATMPEKYFKDNIAPKTKLHE